MQAARHHLAALAAAPFVLYALVAWTAGWTFGRRLPQLRISGWVYVTYVFFFIGYAVVLRKLPVGAVHLVLRTQPGVGNGGLNLRPRPAVSNDPRGVRTSEYPWRGGEAQ